jgi:prepilin-type N-terminal cleavage/methylation domain-containing protein
MKTHPSRRKDGFTLIELLVVIAIVAVLAAASFGGVTMAIQRAKKVTAQATCTGIEQAVNSFYTEYGGMPTATTTADAIDAPALNTKTDKEFLNILLGFNETANPPLNTKGIKFLSVKDGKLKGATDGINGIILAADGKSVDRGLFDPWGGPYNVLLDTGADERVNPQPKGGGAPANPLNNRRCAVWSDGADGVGATGKAADDVRTW